MIIWFNCKISDIRLSRYSRYNLRHDTRFDIAKYSFASYAPLAPITTKFVFDLSISDGYAGREQEMESWLRSVFPEDKLVLNWKRRDHIDEWKELLNQYDDDLFFITGNEDHIFMDSNIDMFTKGINILAKDNDRYSLLNALHYPESMHGAKLFDSRYIDDWVVYPRSMNDSMCVMHRSLVEEHINEFEQRGGGDSTVFRLEDWHKLGYHPTYNYYTCTKEQFIHFDGYSHVMIGPEVSPPLEIPPKFFEGQMIIRYGFTDHDNECVNINPSSNRLYAADINGADYKFCLEDIPSFWKDRIQEVRIADNFSIESAKQDRDVYVLSKAQIPVGGYWASFGHPKKILPIEWFTNHLISLDHQQ